MGFYLRKSISVGPLRFNLSKSGIGVSAGVKGFRVGMGPRGNYVHMGRGGVYYRATLPPANLVPSAPTPIPASQPAIPIGTHAPLEEIESAHVSELVDSSSKELLAELNSKRTKIVSWPFVAGVALFAVFKANAAQWPTWAMMLVSSAGIFSVWGAHTWDSLRKTVVMFYDFDDEMEVAYAELHQAASELASCASTWHIEASGRVLDRKYHAGATDLVSRKRTSIKKAEPPYVKANIETVSIGVGKQTLHFFPDRVLIYEKNGVGAVSYRDLKIETQNTRFVESESVPRDAQVVGKTWRYVNKSGGPDRRFKDNQEIPVCLYEELTFSSQSGLLEVIQLSRAGFGNAMSSAITRLGQKLPADVQAA